MLAQRLHLRPPTIAEPRIPWSIAWKADVGLFGGFSMRTALFGGTTK